MTEMITRKGLARHPEYLDNIIDLIKNSKNNKAGEFNTIAMNLLGAWSVHNENNPKLNSRLRVTGIGFTSVASVVLYDVADLRIIKELDEEISAHTYFNDISKTTRTLPSDEVLSGLIFNSDGDLSDGFNVGIWVPEEYSDRVIVQVDVANK